MFAFDTTYTSLPATFFTPQAPTPITASATAPQFLAVNRPLAEALGLDLDWLSGPEGLAILAGNRVTDGSTPIAQAYAGHQFGGWVPRLGDGRAVLLGELAGDFGQALPHRVDVALKGSGPTPYSRRGDGRAWMGPVLREYLVSEAIAALGVPTTRALAAVATGARVQRERGYPGAVLTRVAASHLRVGTFQYATAAAMASDAPPEERLRDLQALCDYAIARHYPDADGALGLLDAVVAAQATLIADWMAVGFIHGVMNTDNMAISGETIDYGPCAFMDGYHPQKVFSSIDRMGRYAFANQPSIAAWNLAQLATSLLPLMEGTEDAAIEAATRSVNGFVEIFQARWLRNFGRKIGIAQATTDDLPLIEGLLSRMGTGQVDFTRVFAGLSEGTAATEFTEAHAWTSWAPEWEARLTREEDPVGIMRATNPRRIPRNHRVEEMIQAAVEGDMAPFEHLLAACRAPYETRPEWEDLARGPLKDEEVRQTFCGT
ncbi:YdiU family protein [Albirhodobacter sp. R86504]|uniref:protein adenylyltransferase SelO n=1 Tax=Albirhodobacter sp. R86504 TaxID=3093848 RepID=UPI00366C46FA